MRESGSASSQGGDSNAVPDYDLARTWTESTPPLLYYVFPLQRGDGGALEYIAVPSHPSAKREDAFTRLQSTALNLANVLEDVRFHWDRQERGEGTEPARDAHSTIKQASEVVAENLKDIVATRFGSHTIAELTDTLVATAIASLAAATRDGLGPEGLEHLMREVDRRAATRVLYYLLGPGRVAHPGLTEDLASRFIAQGRSRLEAERRLVIMEFAHNLAEAILRQYQPGRIRLSRILDLMRSWSHGNVDPIAFDVPWSSTVHLPTDEALRRLACFITRPPSSGETAPLRLADHIERRSYHQHIDVCFDERLLAEMVGPERTREVCDRIRHEPSEVRAKVLLAVFALATHHELPQRGTARIDLDYLMTLITGYHRSGPHRAKLERFNLKLAEVLRCALIELPGWMISSTIKRVYEAEPVVARDARLMAIPRLETKHAFNHAELYQHLAGVDAIPGADSTPHPAVLYLKGVRPTHITVVLSPDAVDAFGASKGASESVHEDIYKLHGASFWLAVDVVFQRRWQTNTSLETQRGVSLLSTLEKYGFTTESMRRTGGRPSFKYALTSFFNTIDELVTMGELDHPGTIVWAATKGHAPRHDAAPTLRRWVAAHGKRITSGDLETFRVAFVVNEARRKHFEKMRKRRASDDARN